MIRKSLFGFSLLSLIVFSSVVSAQPTSAQPIDDRTSTEKALLNYLQNGDDSYEWKVIAQGKIGDTSYAELRLVSQNWRSLVWKHQLYVITPSTCKPETDHALLFITGGRWREELEKQDSAEPAKKADDLPREAKIFATMAEQLETPIAVILQVPFQPIFDGKVEDEIISYTFQEFLETGDPNWPLLLPMVKSAVKGMDATQEFLKQTHDLNIETFTLSGASKRGWTTWLTGAVDERAKAIAPMVIDVLNMVPQMEHQKFSWGGYSEEINDYSEKGIQDWMTSEQGEKLLRIVDPYSYREQLVQPKLIMLGTNDAYWPVDALNLYWDALNGRKYILYVPNKGHGLDDFGRVLGTINGFHRSARGVDPMPEMEWDFETTETGLKLVLKCNEKPSSVSLWSANADTRDFRKSQWKSRTVAANGESAYEIQMECPEEGYCSFFLEASFDRGGIPMFLSTNLKVLGSEGESKPKLP